MASRFARAPQAFQIKVGAYRRLHDVNHNRTQINQYPFTGLFTLCREYFTARFAYLIGHTACQSAHLAVRLTAGQHNAFEHLGHFGRVNNDDVTTLDIFQRINGNGFKFFDREFFRHAVP